MTPPNMAVSNEYPLRGHLNRRRSSKHAKKIRPNGRDSIVVIGPFKSQVLDLEATDSSCAASCLSRTSTPGQPRITSPEICTPATPPRTSPDSVYHTPPFLTDWVEYSAPVAGFEDLDMDRSSDTMELDISMNRPDKSEAEAWTRSLFERLQVVGRVVPLVKVDQATATQVESCSSNDTAASSLSSVLTLVPSEEDQPARLREEENLFATTELVCDACDGRSGRMVQLLPCKDLACPSCFSSTLAAVSVTQGMSKCPACIRPVSSFEMYRPDTMVPLRAPSSRRSTPSLEDQTVGGAVVLRIDNVAWDIEPSMVEKFLPEGTLPPDHPHPVHVCLNRRDGGTKDYLYVEVKSAQAAHRVLQTRQNSMMTGGRITNGVRRAVTVTLVTREELLRELRPGSKSELVSVLELCEAALSTKPTVDAQGRGHLSSSMGANGKVHYLKHRYSPFHVLMSIISKLDGPESQGYWDVFHVASGALAALAISVKTKHDHSAGDADIFAALIGMFNEAFLSETGVVA